MIRSWILLEDSVILHYWWW